MVPNDMLCFEPTPDGTVVKNPCLTRQETRATWVQSMDWEDLMVWEMATHSRTLAWKIPLTVEPGGPQSTGSKRVRHGWAIQAHADASLTWLTPSLVSHQCLGPLSRGLPRRFSLWSRSPCSALVAETAHVFLLTEHVKWFHSRCSREALQTPLWAFSFHQPPGNYSLYILWIHDEYFPI